MKTDKCAQCGWVLEEHRNGYCYHYSDEDTDYFYSDRKFVSKKSLKGKKYRETFDGKIIIYPLADAVLKVLKKWNKPNGDFDAMWYGYECLMDEIKQEGHSPTVRELKKEIKNLKQSGKIELRPTYDYEYHLSGRGWFLCEETPQVVETTSNPEQ